MRQNLPSITTACALRPAALGARSSVVTVWLAVTAFAYTANTPTVVANTRQQTDSLSATGGRAVGYHVNARLNGAPGVAPVGNPFQFAGGYCDAESGLVHYRTRYYDPRAGRFVSRDTIGVWGDARNLGNGFAYVGSSPWSRTDPMGLDGGTVTLGGGVSISGGKKTVSASAGMAMDADGTQLYWTAGSGVSNGTGASASGSAAVFPGLSTSDTMGHFRQYTASKTVGGYSAGGDLYYEAGGKLVGGGVNAGRGITIPNARIPTGPQNMLDVSGQVTETYPIGPKIPRVDPGGVITGTMRETFNYEGQTQSQFVETFKRLDPNWSNLGLRERMQRVKELNEIYNMKDQDARNQAIMNYRNRHSSRPCP